ncbi:MAG: hypothetical protein ABEK36_04065 [Candidatus Aenigmatarchaeota archaeon]
MSKNRKGDVIMKKLISTSIAILAILFVLVAFADTFQVLASIEDTETASFSARGSKAQITVSGDSGSDSNYAVQVKQGSRINVFGAAPGETETYTFYLVPGAGILEPYHSTSGEGEATLSECQDCQGL